MADRDPPEDPKIVDLKEERLRRDAIIAEVERLARLSVLDYVAGKGEAQKNLKTLGITVTLTDIDRLVKAKRIELGIGAKPPAPSNTPPGGWPKWHEKLRTDDKERIIPDFRNALIALRGDPGYSTAFAFEGMLQEVILLSQPPLAEGAKPGAPTPRLIDDEDVSRAHEWLQSMRIDRLSRGAVEFAIDELAKERIINPLKDRLLRLEAEWDGEPRIGAWLHDYLGTPDDEYHRQVGSMFLTALVKRIFEPGCQSDYVLVLEGEQGELKSSLLRILAGDEYFCDSLPSIGGQDQVRVSQYLRGKWLVEIGELDAFAKAGSGTIKAFISRREEAYIPKYGRRQRRELRTCLFVITTNDDEYLKDETGGRRFWPVKVIVVNLAGFAAARDQLLGEAVAAYHEGKPTFPDRDFEKAVIAPVQEDRQVYDSLEERVRDKLTGIGEIKMQNLGGQLGFTDGQFNREIQLRFGAILKKLNWRKVKDHKNGGKIWKAERGQGQLFCPTCGWAIQSEGCKCDKEFP